MVVCAACVSLVLLVGTTATTESPEESIERGRALLEERSFEAAAAAFHLALEHEPDNADVSYLMGLACFGARRFEAAEDALRRALPGHPRDPLLHEFLGRTLFHMNRFSEASEVLRAATELESDDPRLWNHLGAALLRLRQPDQARAAFEQSVRCDPSFAVAHFNIGVLASLSGELLTGINHLEEAARLDRQDSDPTEALGDLHRDVGDWEKARTWYRESVARAPETVRLWVSLGAVEESLGRLFAAECAYRTACDLPESRPASHQALGTLLEARGAFGEAQEIYEEALRRWPDEIGLLHRLADLCQDAGNPERARRHLQALLERSADDIELLARMVRTCEELDDPDEARRQFGRLIEANDGSRFGLLTIADLMATSMISGIRDPQRGFAVAQALVEMSGGEHSASLFVLAEAERALGRDDASVRSLERAMLLLEEEAPMAAHLRRRVQAGRQH